MTLPLTTTTVTIADAAEPEPYEGETVTTRGSGVAAHIGSPSGFGDQRGGGQETWDAALYVDSGVTVERNDRVTDEVTGKVWRVLDVNERSGLGLDHVVAGLRRASGRVPA